LFSKTSMLLCSHRLFIPCHSLMPARRQTILCLRSGFKAFVDGTGKDKGLFPAFIPCIVNPWLSSFFYRIILISHHGSSTVLFPLIPLLILLETWITYK